jgi:hypothetical protein
VIAVYFGAAVKKYSIRSGAMLADLVELTSIALCYFSLIRKFPTLKNELLIYSLFRRKDFCSTAEGATFSHHPDDHQKYLSKNINELIRLYTALA